MEALWIYANIGIHKEDLLAELINCEVPEARAAAARQIRHWPKSMMNSAEKLISESSNDPDADDDMMASYSTAEFSKKIEKNLPNYDNRKKK